MPLARILTFDPAEAHDFAQQLCNLGFQVEVVNPNERPLAPANLEVEFVICDQQQVLARASAIAAQLQAEVVVFPDAIPPVPRSLTAPQAEPELPVEEAEKPVSEPINAMEAEGAVCNAATMPAQDASGPGEPGSRPFAFNTRKSVTQLVERLRQGRERLNTALAGVNTALARGRSRAKTELVSFKNLVSARASSFQGGLIEYVALARTAVRHRIEQAKTRRAEAAERAAALEPERQKQASLAAPEREQELQRILAERATLMAEIERLRAEANRQAAMLEQTRLSPEGERSPQASLPLRQPASAHHSWLDTLKAARLRRGQLRGALAGAVTASFLFLLGMVWANFQAMKPFSGNLKNGSVEQQVPFGSATIHGQPGATVVGPGAPASRSNSAPPVQTTQPPKAAGAVKPPAKPSPEWHHFRNGSGRSETPTNTEDVVVRHFGSPHGTTTQTAQQTGIKRYSDE